MNDEERAFLDGHTYAVLVATRRDGAPQQSMVAYAADTMDDAAEGDRTLNVGLGFGGWLKVPAAAPVRWEQACTVFAALVTVSLVVTATRTALLPGLPVAAATPAITALANVLILTWLLMPLVTGLAEPWLEP